MIDLDAETLAALRSWRARLGSLSLSLASADGFVLGRFDGGVRHPERFSRSFVTRVSQAQKTIPGLPAIRLHDLRHTHATILLGRGVHPKVVSERLGHADTSITLNVYSHVTGTLQREAADLFASAIYGGTA